jgi:dolichyl-phosphate beta-glucosyltransferase
MKFCDYQYGAKLFKDDVIKQIVSLLTVGQWAFDVEILYLCKRFKFTVQEISTVWDDQTGSKLNILAGGLPMLSALIKLRLQYQPFKRR